MEGLSDFEFICMFPFDVDGGWSMVVIVVLMWTILVRHLGLTVFQAAVEVHVKEDE